MEKMNMLFTLRNLTAEFYCQISLRWNSSSTALKEVYIGLSLSEWDLTDTSISLNEKRCTNIVIHRKKKKVIIELNFDFFVSYLFNSPPSPSKNKCSIATNGDEFAF